MKPLTREGFFWLLVALGLLATGLLKNINLITLLACFMLALVVVNWFLAGRQVKRLTGRRRISQPVFARTPFPYTLEVNNSARRNRTAITILDQGPDHRVSWFVTRLPGREKVSLVKEIVLPRRGRYPLNPLLAVCGYPWGLVRRRRWVDYSEEIIVLPELGQLYRGLLRRFLSHASPTLGQAKLHPRRHPTAQSEFYGVRSFRAGDSPRWIHWRTTARRGEIMVREFEEMPSDNLILIVESLLTEEPSRVESAHLEVLISLAATICWEWCRQKGDAFVLGLAGHRPVVLSGVTGLDFALTMLEHLAVERGTFTSSCAELANQLQDVELPPGPVLLVTTRAGSSAGFLSQALQRRVACINVAEEEYSGFFQL